MLPLPRCYVTLSPSRHYLCQSSYLVLFPWVECYALTWVLKSLSLSVGKHSFYSKPVFREFYFYLCVCMSVCHICACPLGGHRGDQILWGCSYGGCELPDTGAENQVRSCGGAASALSSWAPSSPFPNSGLKWTSRACFCSLWTILGLSHSTGLILPVKAVVMN